MTPQENVAVPSNWISELSGSGDVEHAVIAVDMTMANAGIFMCALTPELSRPARGEPGGAEAAKRARLERIVRRVSQVPKTRL